MGIMNLFKKRKMDWQLADIIVREYASYADGICEEPEFSHDTISEAFLVMSEHYLEQGNLELHAACAYFEYDLRH